jgi:phytoene synthase
MTPIASQVRASYQHCQRMARRASSSFYWSMWTLPAKKRAAMYSLYAFSRHTDDLSDSDRPMAQRRAQLEHWRSDLSAALQDEYRHPLLPSLIDTVRRFDIPDRYLFQIIDGVEMDLRWRRYETFQQLREYCQRVASAVGQACLHIWGFEGDEVWDPAADCGVAFQLTNILRDLGEDAARDRIYLPLEDLRRFDYSASDLLQGVADHRFRALLRFEVERAERLYDRGRVVLRYLRHDGRRMFLTMFHTYRGLLRVIDRRGGELFRRRLRLGLPQRVAIAATPWLKRHM